MILRKAAYIVVRWTIFTAFFVVATPFSALANEGGTVKGVVKTPWIRHYQALLYIEEVEGKEFSPQGAQGGGGNPFISQKNNACEPHVLPVLKGTTVDFTNDDTVDHNIFVSPGSSKKINLGKYGAGTKKTLTFDKLGEVPLLCNLHAEMSGYIIVLQNPYFALTDKKGNFEIKDIPPGTYRLVMWHEKLKEASREVTIEGGNTTAVKFKKKELKRR